MKQSNTKKSPLARGLFISFEGGEGAGKSTQVKLLADRIAHLDIPVRTFREPGGNKIGEEIRLITHNPKHSDMDYRTEALLLAAGRAQLVTDSYKPALKRHEVIIADRYVDSSYAYQGYARDLGYEQIKEINEFAINGLLPDATFLLDIDYTAGQERRHGTTKIDRLDLQDNTFYETVHRAYRIIAKNNPERFTVIDATKSIMQVHEEVWQRVQKLIESAS
jgi:dTMP kinase